MCRVRLLRRGNKNWFAKCAGSNRAPPRGARKRARCCCLDRQNTRESATRSLTRRQPRPPTNVLFAKCAQQQRGLEGDRDNQHARNIQRLNHCYSCRALGSAAASATPAASVAAAAAPSTPLLAPAPVPAGERAAAVLSTTLMQPSSLESKILYACGACCSSHHRALLILCVCVLLWRERQAGDE